jgi:hypothetical protein
MKRQALFGTAQSQDYPNRPVKIIATDKDRS